MTAQELRGDRAPRRAWRPRLVRTALPLMATTALNGVLGVAYWVVAARLYDHTTVATNMAIIAAVTTLSGVSQLNLGPSLAVLIPRAAGHSRRVVLQVYSAVTVYSLVVIAGFLLLVLPHLTRLSAALDGSTKTLLFGVAVVCFNLFALQDAALAALRRGVVIPVENGLFGVAKIGLLAALAVSLPAFGIFASWFVPMVLLVPVVSGYVLLGRHSVPSTPLARTTPRESLPELGQDYAGYLFQVSSTFFLPVIALELLEPASAAIFSVAWLTSSTLDLLSTNVGTALTVETSYGESPGAMRRTILRRAVPAVTTVALFSVLLAPWVLDLYGADYSAHGLLALDLLLVAGVPRSLVTFAIAECRAHRRIGTIVWLRAQNATLVLGLSLLLAPRIGVAGMCVAWLVAQLAGAASATVLVWQRRVPSEVTR